MGAHCHEKTSPANELGSALHRAKEKMLAVWLVFSDKDTRKPI